MVCVYCCGHTKINNSRLQKKVNKTWRRRQCLNCGAVFSSVETPVHYKNWQVKNIGDELKPFLEDRLFLSIYESLKHRENAVIDARELTNTIISKLGPYMSNGLISSSAITNTAQVCLNRFDKVASTHYQAFHR